VGCFTKWFAFWGSEAYKPVVGNEEYTLKRMEKNHNVLKRLFYSIYGVKLV